jgi:hypothetical protein
MDAKVRAARDVVIYTELLDEAYAVLEGSGTLEELRPRALWAAADIASWHCSVELDEEGLRLSSEVIRPISDSLLLLAVCKDSDALGSWPMLDPDELAESI